MRIKYIPTIANARDFNPRRVTNTKPNPSEAGIHARTYEQVSLALAAFCQ